MGEFWIDLVGDPELQLIVAAGVFAVAFLIWTGIDALRNRVDADRQVREWKGDQHTAERREMLRRAQEQLRANAQRRPSQVIPIRRHGGDAA